MSKRLLIILGFSIIALLALGGILLHTSPVGQSVRPSEYEEDKLPFDKSRWTIRWQMHQSGENDRHYMLHDLMTNYLTVGMDSTAVINILGIPERDFGFSYNLGLYRSGFDPTFLIIEFDENGKVKRVTIETI